MKRRIHAAALFTTLLLALPAGCVSRIAPHDGTIAAGLAELRSRNTRFFDELQQAAGTPDAAWECHIAWYDETHAEIAALRTRSASYGRKNDPTADALALLDRSVAELEQVHAEGLSRERSRCCARCSTRSCTCSSSWKRRRSGPPRR